METNVYQSGKRNIRWVAILIVLFMSPVCANVMFSAPAGIISAEADTSQYQSYTGKVIDSETGKPLVFANVVLKGTNIGTVTNAEGEFLLKAPSNWQVRELEVTYIGYRNRVISLDELAAEQNRIELQAATVPIASVTIKYGDPLELLMRALTNIPDNYSDKPVTMKAFYREAIKQDRNYVGVAEAVLDIYKSGYNAASTSDRTLIYKGRKSQDVRKMDTVIVKLQGGPFICLLLDLVKNPGDILSKDYINEYDYSYGGITTIQDREAIIIRFKPQEYVKDPLYEGQIYLDEENLAIMGIDFNLDEKNVSQAADLFIRKKPALMKVDIESANYLTKYRIIDGTWYLSYVRSELDFQCKWKRKLFRSDYSLMSEMAVTDVNPQGQDKISYRESVKMNDILAEQVSRFEDPGFWGEDNIIKPDESIESAIERLNRRMRRTL